MDQKFIQAFRDVMREEIVNRRSVDIGSLGRFEVIHEKQHQEKMDNGQVLMMPPRDVVLFTPEQSEKK